MFSCDRLAALRTSKEPAIRHSWRPLPRAFVALAPVWFGHHQSRGSVEVLPGASLPATVHGPSSAGLLGGSVLGSKGSVFTRAV